MTFVHESRYASVIDLPVALPQTEVRRGNAIRVAGITLEPGQRLEIRNFTLNLIRVLSPGVVSDRINTPQGLCSFGLYFGSMLCTPMLLVVAKQVGAVTLNGFVSHSFVTPGYYSAVVFNNTGRAATGAVD